MCTCSRSLTVCSSKSKNRWGNWYLGHPRPSSALCEGETDVNELLSCGWRNGILCSYLTYPPHPLLSPASRQPLEAPAWVFGSEGVTWDGDPDALIFCLPFLCFRPEIRSSPCSSARHWPPSGIFLTKSLVVCSGMITKASLPWEAASSPLDKITTSMDY